MNSAQSRVSHESNVSLELAGAVISQRSQISVFDDFLPNPDQVRESALRSGFGTWHPNKGDIGAAFYSGVNFWGDHASCFRALHQRIGSFIPSSMFFRITNPSMERALIHSDREYGERTAIIYLSQASSDVSGTAFYRHRETGMTEMPPLEELMRDPHFFEQFKRDMTDESAWERYEFVAARYNRCVVFDAPLIHCRIPQVGYGSSESDSRMVWVAHFGVPHA